MSQPDANLLHKDPHPSDEYEVEDVLGCGRLLVRYTTGKWAGKRSTVDPNYNREKHDRHDTEV